MEPCGEMRPECATEFTHAHEDMQQIKDELRDIKAILQNGLSTKLAVTALTVKIQYGLLALLVGGLLSLAWAVIQAGVVE